MIYVLVGDPVWGGEYRYSNTKGEEIAFCLDPKIPFGITMLTPAHEDDVPLTWAWFIATIRPNPEIPLSLAI